MKKQVQFLIRISCFALLGATTYCSEVPTEAINAAEIATQETNFENDRRFLQDLGYDTGEMEEDGEYYFLPPDRLINKANVREMQKHPQTRMTSGLQNFEQEKIAEPYRTIHLNCSNVSDDEMEYLKAAVNEWNKISGSSIRFLIGSGENSVEVYTYHTEDMLNKSWLMRVEYPMLNKPGKKIEINTRVAYFFWLPKQQHTYLYMHALGHLVGFSHTGKGYHWIKNTEEHDPYSIMQSEEYFSTITGEYMFADMNLWSGFTEADIAAIRLLYSIPDQELKCVCTPKATGNNGNILKRDKEYQFTASYSNSACPDPIYSITITKQDAGRGRFVRNNLENGKVSVVFEPGIYKVKAVVTNMTGTPSTEETYYVTTNKPWVQGPDQMEIGKTYDFYVNYIDPACPKPEFTVTADNWLFSNDLSQVTITQISSGHYKIRFSEYGSYKIIFGINNLKGKETSFCFTKLYRPYAEYLRYQVASSDSTDPLEQELCGKFDGRFSFKESKYGSSFTVFPHRFIAELQFRVARNKIHTNPMQIDHIITTEKKELILLNAGTSVLSIPLSRIETTLAADFPNTPECYTILEPFYDLVYPYDDFCGEEDENGTPVVVASDN